MTKENQSTQVLDELLNTLESVVDGQQTKNESPPGKVGDAIERVLASPERKTRVSSLREAPEVSAFRDALVDGLIRVDTANQLLRLVNDLIVRLMA